MTKELYIRLGISETATDKEIEEAYRRLSVSCDTSSRKYAELTEAYNILSDIDKRAYYDIKGKMPSKNIQRRKGSGTNRLEKIQKARFYLNSVFMIGAVASAILFMMYLSNKNPRPFYIVCSLSMAIKVVEFILRLIP